MIGRPLETSRPYRLPERGVHENHLQSGSDPVYTGWHLWPSSRMFHRLQTVVDDGRDTVVPVRSDFDGTPYVRRVGEATKSRSASNRAGIALSTERRSERYRDVTRS